MSQSYVKFLLQTTSDAQVIYDRLREHCTEYYEFHNAVILTGNLEVVKLTKCFEKHMSWYAAAENHLIVLKWLIDNGCKVDNNTLYYLFKNGQLTMAKYLITNRSTIFRNAYTDAALFGHLSMLVWLRENNYTWDKENEENIFNCAASGGHLHVLKWLHEHKYKWDSSTTRLAAKSGKLNVLMWLKENNCPWDEDAVSFAASNGHFDVFIWLIQNGCNVDKKVIFGYALQGGNIKILEWLKTNKYILDKQHLDSRDFRDLKTLRWLIQNGGYEESVLCNYTSYYTSRKYFNEVVWLKQHHISIPYRVDEWIKNINCATQHIPVAEDLISLIKEFL